MVFAADYPFMDIFWTMVLFFLWAIWLWMVIAVIGDVFVREDISGLAKAAWVVFAIVLPYFGVLVYLVMNSQGMARRNERARQLRSESGGRAHTAPGSGAVAEIERAKELLDSDAITQAEFDGIKAKALA